MRIHYFCIVVQYLEWQRESLLHRYHQFVTENHPNIRPERGVGVHGLTTVFMRQGKSNWQPCFRVTRYYDGNTPRPPAKVFTFSKPFSEVWSDAVAFWAEEHGIRAEDTSRLLRNAPDPDQLKRLRRQMNAHEGHDIPVEALSPVSAEQRSKLAKERAVLKAAEMKLHVGMPATPDKDTQAEMAAWFASVSRPDQR